MSKLISAEARHHVGVHHLEEGDRQGADHRYQDDECAPGARRGEQICVVAHRELAEEQAIVDQADQVAEPNRAKAGHDADDQGQDRQKDQPYTADVVIGGFGSG